MNAQLEEQREVGDGARVALCYSGCHRRGGVERVVFEAASHLAAAHWQCSVIARDLSEARHIGRGVHLVPISGKEAPIGLGLRRTQRRTTTLMREGGYDVVGGFGVQAPPDSVVWVQSVHAAWWEQSRKRRRGLHRLRQQLNPFHRIVLGMERELFEGRAYRRLIALTPEVRADLGRFYGVPERDVDLLPNGFAAQEFNPRCRYLFRERMRHALKIPEAAWVVLFVANEWERKGLMPLLESIAALADGDVHLVAAGRLPEAQIRRRAENLGIGAQVHVVGPSSLVNHWYGMADVFALPTVYEAWGMVVVEALACGLPVLTSRGAGAAVAVEPGRTGLLLDDPESVEEITEGLAQLRASSGAPVEEIAASVGQYEWGAILRRYEEILRGVMAGNKGEGDKT